jgi:ABC-type antimicrobial peptide transport system permease subunit
VAIVNEAFARTFFGRPQVVGEFIQIFGDAPRQIVAVVGDVKSRSGAGWIPHGLSALATPAPPTMYVPLAQVEARNLQSFLRSSPVSWAVRTRGASPSVTSAIQQTVEAGAPQFPFLRFETMEQVIAKDLETERFLMTLLAVFAATAMILATIGIYGLTAYIVTQRTQEVGIRMALGATSTRVLRTFVSEGLSLAAIGLAIGLASALLVTRLLASMVFDVTPHDPITFAAVGVVLLSVSGLATLFPSVKASRTDPVRVMRTE